MKVVIETQRLLLSEFKKSNAQLIFDLNRDPEVIQYTYDPIKDIQHAQQILDEVILPQYTLYTHGRWALYLKNSKEFMGWCGLKNRPERNEIDLGYRLKREFWGKGYATEAALACIKYGFEKLGLIKITGRAVPGNKGSIRVLEKYGMQFTAEEIVDGYPVVTYEISNPLIH